MGVLVRMARLSVGAALALAMTVGAARADSLDELDKLAGAQATDAAMALARDQIGRGELLEAIATLERALFVHPEAKHALLWHAALLCRVDDRDGAAAELGRLKKDDFGGHEWRDVLAPCGDAIVRGGH